MSLISKLAPPLNRAERILTVLDSGDAQQWRILGSVSPTREGGVSAHWQTETFWLLP